MCFGTVPAAHVSDQQRIFDNLALSAAATDSNDVVSDGLKEHYASNIIAARECLQRTTHCGNNGTGAERAGLRKYIERRRPLL